MNIIFYDKDFSIEIGVSDNGIFFDVNAKEEDTNYFGGCVTIPYSEIDNLIKYLRDRIKENDG